jgi:hypothetical protein
MGSWRRGRETVKYFLSDFPISVQIHVWKYPMLKLCVFVKSYRRKSEAGNLCDSETPLSGVIVLKRKNTRT